MKALTVWQPWASLIAQGFKPYEFRSWPAHTALVGTRIAIHAGARKVRKAEVQDLCYRLRSPVERWRVALKPEAKEWLDNILTAPESLPRSAVVCTALLGIPLRGWQVAHEFGCEDEFNDSDRDEHSNWAWALAGNEAHRPTDSGARRTGTVELEAR